MKKCPYCAEEIKKEAIKCKHCKEDTLNENKKEEKLKTEICPHCFHKNEVNDTFCFSCKKMIIQSNNNSYENKGVFEKDLTLKHLGFGLFAIGCLVTIYFFIGYDTSVEVPTTEWFGQEIGGGRVNNLGLMQNRQNGIIFGAMITFIGLFLGFKK